MTAKPVQRLFIRRRHVFRALFLILFIAICYLTNARRRKFDASESDAAENPNNPIDILPPKIEPQWLSLEDAFNAELSAGSSSGSSASDAGVVWSGTIPKQFKTAIQSDQAPWFPKLKAAYLSSGIGQKEPVEDNDADDIEDDDSQDESDDAKEDDATENHENDESDSNNLQEDGDDVIQLNSENKEGLEDAISGQLTYHSSRPSIQFREDIGRLSDAAGISKDAMVELLKDRLVKTEFGITDSEFARLVLPKPVSQSKPKWEGDSSYLFQNGIPTCFGKPCTRNEYVNIQINLTRIATSQFMSPYWIHVDLSKLTYTPENTLLTRCRENICPNNNCTTIASKIPPIPNGSASLVRIRRLVQLLAYFKNLYNPSTHCILSQEPKIDPLAPQTLTTFTPVMDAPIGEKVKRARFIGDSICSIFNASKSDTLHYIGIHQCPRARQMIVPLPKASPLIVVDPNLSDHNSKKRRKGKKGRKQLENPSAIETVQPTLTVRYIKIDKSRYHQFHNPVLVALKNSFVSFQGVVFNNKLLFQLDSNCAGGFPESGDVFPVLESPTITKLYSQVFVASSPSDRTSVSHWLLFETLPRIAMYFDELNAHPDIRIHYNVHGGNAQFLGRMLRFLGMSGFLEESSGTTKREASLQARLIHGDVYANVLYIPEPSLYCLIPPEYQLHKLRSLITSRLLPHVYADSAQTNQRTWDEILIIRSKSPTAITNYNALVRMLEKEFRDYTVRLITDEDGMPSSLKDTFTLFHKARIVIALEQGVGLGYLVSTQFGASVIEVLREPRERMGWNLGYSVLARSLGITWYGMVIPYIPAKPDRVVDLIEMHGMVAGIIADLK
ncbi:hypothetical protein BDR26DRAFT_920780 [Obelidium mucronatum]|nr:hypothetical protein BDR26DRAFT_920780 [Obelidium mucronatum]